MYCALSGLTGEECILKSVPDGVADKPLISPYFVWMLSVHEFLTTWKDKLRGGQYTYDDLFKYKDNYLELLSLVEAVAASSTLVPVNELEEMMSEFCCEFHDLNVALIPHVVITPKFHHR